MSIWVHSNESYLDYPASKEMTLTFGIQLAYGIPSIVKYVILMRNIVRRTYNRYPFYKLFLLDAVIVNSFDEMHFHNTLFQNITAFTYSMCLRFLGTGLFPQLLVWMPLGRIKHVDS